MPPRGGGIDTTTKSNAQAIQQNLRKNGVASTLEKKKNGNWIINYILSFTQLVHAPKIVENLKQDKHVDDKDMKMDDSIAARVVDIDIQLAMKQAPNVKFSYIDNKIRPEKGLDKLDEYKIKDLDKMDDFFEIIETDTINENKNNNEDYKQLYQGDDEIEKWWFNQTETLKHNIELQFTNSEEEYELIGINLLYNSKHATKYLQHAKYENSVLMFHGARQEDMGSIFKTGFRMDSDKSIGSLYGKGHYFTPQALHAIRYLSLCKGYENEQQFALIAAFVNPGRIKTVHGMEYRNKVIQSGYDCHYVKVTDGMNGAYIGSPITLNPNYKGDIMEEYAIKDSTRILPRFYITLKRVEKVFIWRDKNIANQFNGSVLKEIKENSTIYGVTETNTALVLVKKKMSKNKVYLITNGAHDGQGLVQKVRHELGLKTDILVFCSAVDWHSKWAKQFKNIQVKSGKNNIVAFIRNH